MNPVGSQFGLPKLNVDTLWQISFEISHGSEAETGQDLAHCQEVKWE